MLDLTRAVIPNAFYSIEECFFSRYYRDCQTYENLLRHVCVAPPQQPVKRLKKILDLGKGPDVIAEHLKELEQITKKGGTIKAGKLQLKSRTKKVGPTKISLPMSDNMKVNKITHIHVISGMLSAVPSEIVINIGEDQFAEFTTASIQSQIERLRMYTEVKMNYRK